jgi:hypothetical protein
VQTIRKQEKMEEIQNNNQTPPDSGSSSNHPTEEHQMKQVKEFQLADKQKKDSSVKLLDPNQFNSQVSITGIASQAAPIALDRGAN